MNPDQDKARLYDEARAQGKSHDEAIAYAEGQPSYGKLQGIARSAVQGATFGFGDEIEGAIAGFGAMVPGGRSPAEAYRAHTDHVRAGLEDFREEHPVLGFGAEFAGGLAAGGAGLLRSGARTAGKIALPKLLGYGAASGGVAAAGASEGGVPERLRAAVPGAVAGTMLAGTVPAAGKVLGKAGRVATDVSGLRGSKLANVLPIESVDDRANATLLRTLERDNLGVDDLARAAGESDLPVNVMDLAGENTRALGRSVQSMPGRGKDEIMDALVERQAGQGGRITTRLKSALGVTDDDVAAKADELLVQRRQRAKPLYDAAYEKSVPKEVLGNVLSKDQFRQAYERGVTIVDLDDVKLPTIAELDNLADVPVQAIDNMKLGLDDIIDSGFDSGRRVGRREAHHLRKLLNKTLARVDEAVPEYKAARAAYAGDSELIDALEEATETFHKSDPSSIRRAMAGMSDGEKDMYRLGVLGSVRERIAKKGDTHNALNAMFNTPEKRARLAAVFPDAETFDAFGNAMFTEDIMASTRAGVLGNSVTARLLQEQEQLAADAAGDIVGAVTSPRQTAVRVAGRAVGNRLRGLTGGVADELSPKLLAGTENRDDLLNLLDELREFTLKQGRKRLRGPIAGTAAATTAGLQVGRSKKKEAIEPETAVGRVGMLGAGMLPVVGETMDLSEIATGIEERDPSRIGWGALGLGLPFVAGSTLRRVVPKKGITAYHGSPHDFDKFSLEHIGSGEGAQAYGHGLYFAENEGVARSYRDALKRIDVNTMADGTPISHDMQRMMGDAWSDLYGRTNQLTVPKMLDNVEDRLMRQRADAMQAQDFEWFKRIEDQRAELARIRESPPEQLGRMYQVRINADPEDFLDWDAPLSEQRGVMERIRASDDPVFGESGSGWRGAPDGLWEQNVGPRTGANIHQELGGNGVAQEKLRQAGIPGIRYYDQMSRGAGEGTRNYVVFDDSLVEILKKYGFAGLVASQFAREQQRASQR